MNDWVDTGFYPRARKSLGMNSTNLASALGYRNRAGLNNWNLRGPATEKISLLLALLLGAGDSDLADEIFEWRKGWVEDETVEMHKTKMLKFQKQYSDDKKRVGGK